MTVDMGTDGASSAPSISPTWTWPHVRHPTWGPTPLTYIGSWTLTFMGPGP
jgi:hypothetical protein